MALDVPTQDRMLSMTKVVIPEKKKRKEKKDVGGRKTVEISRHFKLFFGLCINFYVKNKVGGEASSLSR